MGVRVALVIGGMNMMKQGAELAKRPHIVIATPGNPETYALINTLATLLYFSSIYV